jgi:hypothetical protein
VAGMLRLAIRGAPASCSKSRGDDDAVAPMKFNAAPQAPVLSRRQKIATGLAGDPVPRSRISGSRLSMKA